METPLTKEEIQKKLQEAEESMTPEERLELLKVLNEMTEEMNRAYKEYFEETEKDSAQ
ncbi:MAG TPA: hypothetical protein VFM02_01885 [Candidatus Paceibacterota bacterium]|nr:hypothetical protein [Candidatus Paceibacterota bacterium]